jgi:SnoaL-like domain
MNKVDPEAVVKQYIDAKDNHRWDELVSLLDPEYTSTDPAIPEPVKGIQAVTQYFPMLEHVYMKTKILTMASKGNDVAAELAVTCSFGKPDESAAQPTGPSFVVKMAKFYRVNSEGLLVDEREYSDPAAKFGSLGPDAAAQFHAVGGEATANFQAFTKDVSANFEAPGDPSPTPNG